MLGQGLKLNDVNKLDKNDLNMNKIGISDLKK